MKAYIEIRHLLARPPGRADGRRQGRGRVLHDGLFQDHV